MRFAEIGISFAIGWVIIGYQNYKGYVEPLWFYVLLYAGVFALVITTANPLWLSGLSAGSLGAVITASVSHLTEKKDTPR